MIKTKVKISPLSNVSFSPECLGKIRNSINSHESNIGIVKNSVNLTDIDFNLDDIAFTFNNAIIENNVLYVDIETLSTEKGRLLEKTFSITDINFYPYGIGTVNESKEVGAYEFITLQAVF